MPNNDAGGTILEEIKELIDKNTEAIEEIQKQVKFIHSYIFWQRVWGTIKVLFIIGLIIVGSIYLPPLIQSAITPYQQLIQELGGQQNQIFENLKKIPGANMFLNQDKPTNAE